jgi:leucyl aminopeptidase
MAGAAVVLGVMRAILDMQAPISLLCVVAACENMPSGSATKPGDILVAMNGKTIEVNNTDAEGRLTLADALCYATQQKPEAVIDIATLTGAVVSALGKVAAGIMGNDDALIEEIKSAGKKAGEKYWTLPLFDEYKESLKSDFADLKNAGSRGEAGSSCAGMFLKEFVDGTPWAHLDVAGVAWTDKDKEELSKGGTAFGVRTLSYFLLDAIKRDSSSPV